MVIRNCIYQINLPIRKSSGKNNKNQPKNRTIAPGDVCETLGLKISPK